MAIVQSNMDDLPEVASGVEYVFERRDVIASMLFMVAAILILIGCHAATLGSAVTKLLARLREVND